MLNNSPKILYADNDNYNKLIVNEIFYAINRSTLDEQCSIMLTGGSSAISLYNYWNSKYDVLSRNSYILKYYIGDERCVGEEDVDSNFMMIRKTLFQKYSDKECSEFFEKIIGDAADQEKEAERYEDVLPKRIDILLLSVGEDGHIASLFSNSNFLYEEGKSVVAIHNSPKQTKNRITITPRVIKNAKNIIVFAMGEIKGLILANALLNPKDVSKFPVGLTIKDNAVWVLDQAASLAFKNK